MKTFTIPHTELSVPNVTLGMMRISDKSDEQIRTLVATAREAGITFFDHADIYGSDWHQCEQRFGEAMQLSPSQRAEITIQTKAGIVRGENRYDFSYDHLIGQVEGSLRALGTDYIDILLLHRPDALVVPEEVARAFDDLEASGKVRHFGVSNHTPRQIDLLRTAVRQPLVANQLQLSIVHCPIIAQGIAANTMTEQATTRDGSEILDYCRINQITIQAWSPVQASNWSGVFLGSDRFVELNAVIDELAAKYQVPADAIATGWITRHPAQMQVVLGTTSPERVLASAQGSELPLTNQEWYRLFAAAGHDIP